jgi:tetratricopeptide (TPR) repeat protein
MKQHTMKSQAETDERTPIRERWTAAELDGSDEARAGVLLRAAAAVRPFGAREMAEVAARLRGKQRFRPRPLAWQLAVAALLMLLGGTLSASVARILHLGYFARPAVEKSVPAPAKAHRVASIVRRPTEPAPAPVEPAQPLPEPGTQPVPAPPAVRPVPAHASGAPAPREESPTPTSAVEPAPATPAPSPAASALARESRLLALAIGELRQDGDAEQALTLLDQYQREFGPTSALAPEANRTRVEALLRLGRHAHALALLDDMTPATTGVGRELLVARAELRADRGRRSAALRDFDRLLAAGGKADAVAERALFGRALCRQKAGDAAGARRDLETYLTTFPAGRFARQARAALNPALH